MFLAEALSRRLGRIISAAEIGLDSDDSVQLPSWDWYSDAVTGLAELGRDDVNVERRVLGAAVYSIAALGVPPDAWWERHPDAVTRTSPADGRDRSTHAVGRSDVDAVRDMTSMFSRMDQRRGGGYARTAVVQYLTADVLPLLRGHFAHQNVRREAFSAAGELAYLAGWMAFDDAEHSIAQRYFGSAVKLAAEADDAPLAGHVLRAMAHQAVDLGHHCHALDLADASVSGPRYQRAGPRERALLGVVHARALAVVDRPREACAALLRAENDLSNAGVDADPARVFFFGEASLAHETACTLRDIGDLNGAANQFRRSVRARKVGTFARTHAVTLGYLGATLARQGRMGEACATS